MVLGDNLSKLNHFKAVEFKLEGRTNSSQILLPVSGEAGVRASLSLSQIQKFVIWMFKEFNLVQKNDFHLTPRFKHYFKQLFGVLTS